MTTSSRLVDEITGESIQLQYDYNDPMWCDGPIVQSMLDIGWPQPRAVGYNNPNANGYTDQTQYWGDSTVSWTGWIRPTADDPYPAVTIDKLRALAAPARRPWLYYQEDGWSGERRIRLRGDQVGMPLTREWGPVVSVNIQWRNQSGAQESATSRQQNISPSGMSTGGTCFTNRTTPPPNPGICWTSSCAPNFVAGYVATETIVNNYGNVIMYPLIIFTGLVNSPVIKNLTTGQTIGLTGSIAANAKIYVDTQHRTVRENNDPNLNRLNMYDFTKSNWMYLAPGLNTIDYSFTGSDAGQVSMIVRDRWI